VTYPADRVRPIRAATVRERLTGNGAISALSLEWRCGANRFSVDSVSHAREVGGCDWALRRLSCWQG
jgi:hypothetical protein